MSCVSIVNDSVWTVGASTTYEYVVKLPTKPGQPVPPAPSIAQLILVPNTTISALVNPEIV